MQLADKKRFLEFVVISVYALIIFYFEALLPRPFIWIKWGFANAFILFLIYKRYPFYWYLLLVIVKSSVGGLVTGNIFTPIFLFSLCGGIGSFLIMYILFNMKIFSIPIISIYGSIVSNSIQLFLAFYLGILKTMVMLFWWIIIFSIITGTVTGIISLFIIKHEFNYKVA